MKRPFKSTPTSRISFPKQVGLLVLAWVMAISLPMAIVIAPVQADEFDARIRQVQAEIDAYQGKANELRAKGNTLQSAVDAFNNEIIVLQKEIDLNQAKHDQIVADILLNEKKIDFNQGVLGDTIADIYVDDKISPLEMLASSKNIGEYVDKQEYRSAVRDRLTDAIDEIKQLKKELEKQRADAERILEDQKGRRGVLEGKRAEQQQLVNQTRGEEAAYQTLTASSIAKKNELQSQQQAAIYAAMRRAGGGGNAVAGDPNKGGYPTNLANSDYYNPIVDPWGMYSRQCVSYTAWKVYQKNGYMPYWGGRGNANQWPGNARAAGITTSSIPRAGSVGVIMDGQYGHVVWVESVNGNGTINISQYNYWNAGGSGWGHYSEMYNVPAAAYNVYIYF